MLDDVGLSDGDVEGLLQRFLGGPIQLVALKNSPELVQREKLVFDGVAR